MFVDLFLGTVASDEAWTCGRRQRSIDFHMPKRTGVTCRVCRGFPRAQSLGSFLSLSRPPLPLPFKPREGRALLTTTHTAKAPKACLGEKGGPATAVSSKGGAEEGAPSTYVTGASALPVVREDEAVGLLSTAELSEMFFPTKVMAFLRPGRLIPHTHLDTAIRGAPDLRNHSLRG